MNRLKGKVAIITGAGLGMGKAIAKLFAKEGAKVAVTDINPEFGEETVKEIIESGNEAVFWKLDVTNEAEIMTVFKEVVDYFGKLDILINNAGAGFSSALTEESTEENWIKVFNLNAKGPFLCTKHAIGYMRKNNGGSIVNTASIDGLVGSMELANYHSAKGAVITMTKQDAVSYAKDNIRVNSICPGVIKTESVYAYADAHPELGGIEGLEKIYAEPIPMKRLGTPQEVAYGMLFLASDEASYITGANLVIDGGQVAK